MSSFIKPTVGRVVLFVPGAAVLPGFAKPAEGEPCAALIAHVHGDRCINVAAFDANGVPRNFTSVTLLQGDDVAFEGAMHAKWMDYQKGQAAKADAIAVLSHDDALKAAQAELMREQAAMLRAERNGLSAQTPQPPVSNARVAPGAEPFTGTAVGLSFGEALEVLKAGGKVAREGWNGKGMWVAYTPGSHVGRECVKPGHALSDIADEMPDRDLFSIGAHIDMRTADGSLMVGWTPNTLDMLADDWQALDVQVEA